MQVVDAATGGTLSLGAATKRFIAIGTRSPCCRSSRSCSRSRASCSSRSSLFLFFTAITNDRRQGLHDKCASSLVIRSRPAATAPPWSDACS